MMTKTMTKMMVMSMMTTMTVMLLVMTMMMLTTCEHQGREAGRPPGPCVAQTPDTLQGFSFIMQAFHVIHQNFHLLCMLFM